PSYPPSELAQRELADHQHARLAVVETRDRKEILAAIAVKDMSVLARDLLERLQTVGREAGRDDGEALHAALGERFGGLDGRGLEPFAASEPRLEREHQLVLVEIELLAQEPRRHHALIVIGIALVDVVLRQAVERGKSHLRLKRKPGERRPRRGRERIDIDGVVV